MRQNILRRVIQGMSNHLLLLRKFLKKNYRSYYDDRSWWDEVG